MFEERKTKQIVLFGRKLTLSERYAGDILRLSSYYKKNTSDDAVLFSYGVMIRDALKVNNEIAEELYRKTSFFKPIKKLRAYLNIRNMKRVTSIDFIMDNLYTSMLIDIRKEILLLEGADEEDFKEEVKKKAQNFQKVQALISSVDSSLANLDTR